MVRNLFEDFKVSENKPKARSNQEQKKEKDAIILDNVIYKYQNKKNIEDTHKRATFLIDKDTLDSFNAICANQKKGFKTEIINTLISNFVNSYDGG